MPYNLASRLDKLGTRFKTLNSNSATYERPGSPIPAATIINFTPEKLDVTALAMFGIVLITDKMQDVVFDAADIVTFGEPEHGDKFTWGAKVLEVMRIGNDRDGETFRYTTSSRLRIRVHIRQVV
jgi:hypothetical protein